MRQKFNLMRTTISLFVLTLAKKKIEFQAVNGYQIHSVNTEKES